MNYLDRKIRICRANNIKKVKAMKKIKEKNKPVVTRYVNYMNIDGERLVVEEPIKIGDMK